MPTQTSSKEPGTKLFGIELEHVEISPKDIREKAAFLENGCELVRYTQGTHKVMTHRLSVNPREYITVVSKIVSTRNCMQPLDLEMIATGSSETPEEAVQLHFDAVNYLNTLGY